MLSSILLLLGCLSQEPTAVTAGGPAYLRHEELLVLLSPSHLASLPEELRSQFSNTAQLSARLRADFVEAEGGESIDLLALRHGLDPHELCLLNALEPGRILAEGDFVCVDRFHRAMPGETVEGLALLYGVDQELLRSLNRYSPEQQPTAYSRVLVPAFSDREFEKTGQCRLRVLDPLPRPDGAEALLDVRARRMHKVQRGETLASIAEHYEVSESSLRLCNPNLEPLEVGRLLAIEVVAQIQPQANSEQVVFDLEHFYGYTLEDVLELNPGVEVGAFPGAALRVPGENQALRGLGRQWRAQPGVVGAGGRIDAFRVAQAVIWDGEVLQAVVPQVVVGRAILLPPQAGAPGGWVEAEAAVPAVPAIAPLQLVEGVRFFMPPTAALEAQSFPLLAAESATTDSALRLPEGLRGRLILTTALEGDTLESIAGRTTVDAETLAWLNALSIDEPIPAGTGVVLRVVHRVLPDETVSSIADSYGDDPQELRQRNEIWSDEEPATWSQLEVRSEAMEPERTADGTLVLHLPRVDSELESFEARFPEGATEDPVQLPADLDLRDLVRWLENWRGVSLEAFLERNGLTTVEALEAGTVVSLPPAHLPR